MMPGSHMAGVGIGATVGFTAGTNVEEGAHTGSVGLIQGLQVSQHLCHVDRLC